MKKICHFSVFLLVVPFWYLPTLQYIIATAKKQPFSKIFPESATDIPYFSEKDYFPLFFCKVKSDLKKSFCQNLFSRASDESIKPDQREGAILKKGTGKKQAAARRWFVPVGKWSKNALSLSVKKREERA